jgi:hypothetical protein
MNPIGQLTVTNSDQSNRYFNKTNLKWWPRTKNQPPPTKQPLWKKTKQTIQIRTSETKVFPFKTQVFSLKQNPKLEFHP